MRFCTVALLNCLFLLACSVEQNPQVLPDEPEVPKYYRSHIKEKEDEINYAIQCTEGNSVFFIFFTDAHWGDNQKNSPALISHLVYSTPIQDVVFGGDVITTFFDDPKDAMTLGKDFQRAFDTLDCNMYYLYGNHDNNSDCNPDLLSQHLSEDQVYDYLQSKMGPCTYGGYYNFYFDREMSKTRFICLDTGRFYYSRFRDKTLDTVSFVVDALNSTPEGWHIILLSHIWAGLQMNADGIKEAYIPAFYQSFLDLFDAYNNRYSGNYKHGNESVDYDFSYAKSRVICCIGGHNHLDALLYSSGGIPVIINTTDSRQTINGDSATKRTIEEQSVSAYIIDYTQSCLRRFRIGRGDDLVVQIDL
jgi:hypothetical protein